jgi:tRNA pseudouridine38-40 synthase
MKQDNSSEKFPLVDEQGQVIGSATRGECHNGSKLLHPVVHLHVFNSKGELYLQKRPEWKDIQPGKWDTAVGGHIDYGETPEDALVREVREELGITDFVPERLGMYVFESKREKELVYVHRTVYDGEIRPSAEELDGGRFWSMTELRAAIGQEILTPNFESEFQRFFPATKRYFITLSYDGTRYHGWQIQPNGESVQERLQGALSTLLREEIIVTGAGRTDAGVHARMMVAHFDTAVRFEAEDGINCPQLAYKLNKLLPYDIAVQKVEQVSDDLHARFSATSRTYHYYIHTVKDPFRRAYSCELHYPLDFDKMNEAAKVLMEYEDFGAFCKSGADVKTTLCQVTEARWIQTSAESWYFEITANRFLRNMVRAVVGTLIDVGRGRLTLDGFRQVIEGKQRTEAGESMPGNALFLEDIKY